MRKSKKLLKQIVTELEKMPNRSYVCQKLGISRQTLYRWIRDDWEFEEALEAAMKTGRDNINDVSESELIKMIRDGKYIALKYWLDNNHKNYKRPRPDNWYQQENRKHVPNEIMFVDFSTGNKETLDEYRASHAEELTEDGESTEPPDNPQQ